MQKSAETQGSVPNPVSEQFWDHFGKVPGGKIHQKSQKWAPKAHAKKQQIFERAFFACGGPPGAIFAKTGKCVKSGRHERLPPAWLAGVEE